MCVCVYVSLFGVATAHLASLRNAVLMLRTRLAMLEEFTRLQAAAAAAGEPLDLASLRRVSALCRSLPALATIDFSDQLAASFNDGAMLAYLASMTRTLDSANALIGAAHILFTYILTCVSFVSRYRSTQ